MSFWYLLSTNPPFPVDFHEEILRQDLLRAAREKVLPQHQVKGFYSPYFLIPKKDGRWKPLLDLRQQNGFIQKVKFHMISLVSIIPSLKEVMWFTPLDLKDTHFHIDIHLPRGRFLRFLYDQDHCQVRVFPLDMATEHSVYKNVFTGGCLDEKGRIYCHPIPWRVGSHGPLLQGCPQVNPFSASVMKNPHWPSWSA